MSELSFMEKLLDGVEVEWKALDEISVKISSGGTPKTGVAEFYDGDIPWLRTQEVDFGEIWDTGVKITEAGVKNSSAKWIPANCIIVAMYGATVGKIGINKIPMTTNQACANIELDAEIADYRYVFHFLSSQYEYIKSLGAGSQTNINAGIVKKLNAPIPCPDNPKKSLEIQGEIVRILDAFTAMTAELTAELNLRKKQYNHYRDQLLSFEEGHVEWKTLGEIALIQRGASPRPIAKYITDSEAGVPWVKIGDTSPGSKYVSNTAQKVTPEGAKKSRILNIGDFIMSNSMSFGRPYIMGIKGAIHDGWASISGFNATLSSDYLYHYLSSNTVQNYWLGKINSGSVSNLNADIIKTLPVPIPTLSEQEKIASILDKFDALTNSITEGLPREIELRQKQYEYYRDLLLSFPKPEEVAA